MNIDIKNIDTKQKLTIRLEHAAGAEEASTEGHPIDVYELQYWLAATLNMMGFSNLADAIREVPF